MADDWSAAADPGALGAVLADTAFGRAWIVHLALLLAFFAATFRPRSGWTGLTLLSGLSLASLGLTGHAVMQAGIEGVAHRANDALHLLCGGAWTGGLIPFLLSLGAFRRGAHAREAVTGMIRFSFYGHFAVAGVVATGVVNVALTSGLPLPPDTPYRALLDVKIGVVAVMIALALVNRYALVPRLAVMPRALATLRAFTIANAGLGTLAIALVSVFGLLNPA